MDDRAEDRARLAERQVHPGVGGVHQRVAAGLDLGRQRVDVVGAGAAGRDDLAADVGVRGEQHLDRPLHLAALRRRGRRRSSGGPRSPSCRARSARGGGRGRRGARRPPAGSRSGAGRCRRRSARRRCRRAAAASIVSGESTATVIRVDRLARGHPRQPLRIEGLVGQQQVVADAGLRHADHLAWRRAGERVVAGSHLRGGERRALVRLDVRAQRRRPGGPRPSSPGCGRARRRRSAAPAWAGRGRWRHAERSEVDEDQPVESELLGPLVGAVGSSRNAQALRSNGRSPAAWRAASTMLGRPVGATCARSSRRPARRRVWPARRWPHRR